MQWKAATLDLAMMLREAAMATVLTPATAMGLVAALAAMPKEDHQVQMVDQQVACQQVDHVAAERFAIVWSNAQRERRQATPTHRRQASAVGFRR